MVDQTKPRGDKTVKIYQGDPEQHPQSGISVDDVVEELSAYGMRGDKYRVENELATGGMATIYKVHDIGLQRDGVLKVMLPQLMKDTELLQRFLNEARTTARLEHPNIIPVNDIGIFGDRQVFFSMKLIDGEELHGILDNLHKNSAGHEKNYTLFSLLTIFRKVCDACAFAHSKGVTHGDIKPENIMVGKYGEVLLVDWGLACNEDDRNEHHNKRTPQERNKLSLNPNTQYGIIRGTPAYMSPEQANASEELIDRRTDIFMLGATLYAIATLAEPFGGDDVYETLDCAQQCRFVPPSERAPDRMIPEELCRIIERAMSKDPENRYQSVSELCDEIDALMEGRAVADYKVFDEGEYLMREGDVADFAYVIDSGTVDVFKMVDGTKVHLVELSNGDCVGELALISQAPRSASVIAKTNTKVIVISQEHMNKGFEKLPRWLAHSVHSLVERLRSLSDNVHLLMNSDCSYHVLTQLRLLYPLLAQCKPIDSSETPTLSAEMAEIVQEISRNLCISGERVTEVMGGALDAGMIRPVDETNFTIPNFRLLCKFIHFIAQKNGCTTALSAQRVQTLYADNDNLVTTIRDEGKAVSNIPGANVSEESIYSILDCESDDEIDAIFDRLYSGVTVSRPGR